MNADALRPAELLVGNGVFWGVGIGGKEVAEGVGVGAEIGVFVGIVNVGVWVGIEVERAEVILGADVDWLSL